MPRLTKEAIQRLKDDISLEQLVEQAGVELKRQGAHLVGNCPFHDDRTLSLVITPAKNLWHCFGSCGQGGSVIDWVMQAEGLGFREAVAYLDSEYRVDPFRKTEQREMSVTSASPLPPSPTFATHLWIWLILALFIR